MHATFFFLKGMRPFFHAEMKRIQDIVGRLAMATKASKTKYSAGINMIDLHDI